MNKELKPCPFCGEVAKVVDVFGRAGVVCTDCCAEMRGYLGMTEEEVIKAWNTRKPIDDQKRKYYKNFVDADYIYKLYFELIEKRDELIERLKEVSFVDIDEEYADGGQRMLFLHDAIEILKGGGLDE